MNSHGSIKYFRLVLAGLLIAILTHTQALATVIDLNFAAAATATDYGPQDGVFDAFAPLNFGSVNNNGYTSFRTAFEFDISAIPAGSTINAATLTMFVDYVDGTRQIALHGYAGDGAVQLADFSLNGLADSTVLNPPGGQGVVFNVTGFIDSLISSGKTFAGFNVREEPANPSNFGVLFFHMDATVPRLSIDFAPRVSADIDIKPGSFPNSINLSSAGVVPVAILSSATFDATQVNPETVSLAGARVKLIGKGDKYSCHAEDVNGDGLLDLLCHVATAQFIIEPGTSVAVLEAETFNGQKITGQDSIEVVP